MRTETGITVAKAMHWLSSEWVVRTLRIGTILALIAVRRWRHLFAVLVAILAVSVSVDHVSKLLTWEHTVLEALPLFDDGKRGRASETEGSSTWR